MRRVAAAHALASLGLALALSAPRLARAEPAPGLEAEAPGDVLTRNAEAVTAGRAALEAYERGDWSKAYEEFRRAESRAHSPVFVLYMARAKERAGARLEALRIYELVSREAVSTTTPAAWKAAIEAASAERAALVERLPSLVVVLGASVPAGTTVTLDGTKLERLEEETPVEPGEHVLVARRVDGLETEQRVTIAEGQKRLRVELGAETRSPPKAVPPRHAQAPSRKAVAAPSSPKARGAPTAAYVTGTVGLASLLFGAVAGTLAWRELRQLQDDCPNDRCEPGDSHRLESVRRLGTLADVGFAAGAAGLGASAVLFWLEPAASSAGAPAGGVRFLARY